MLRRAALGIKRLGEMLETSREAAKPQREEKGINFNARRGS